MQRVYLFARRSFLIVEQGMEKTDAPICRLLDRLYRLERGASGARRASGAGLGEFWV